MFVPHLLGLATLRPALPLFGLVAARLRPAIPLFGLIAATIRPAAALFGLMADVTLNPNANGMPGASFAQTLLDWTGQIALWGSLAAILVGAAIYGLSQHVGNTYGASKGRVLALAGAVGAGLTGVAPTAINLLHSAATR